MLTISESVWKMYGCIHFLWLAAVIKYHRWSEKLKQKLIFSPFWRLEVQDQGVSRVGLLWGLSPWLRWSCSCCLFTRYSFCPHLSLASFCVWISSSYKDSSQIGLGPILTASFSINHWFKALSPKTVIFWGTGGKGFNIWILEGHNSAHRNRYSLDCSCNFSVGLNIFKMKSWKKKLRTRLVPIYFSKIKLFWESEIFCYVLVAKLYRQALQDNIERIFFFLKEKVSRS